MRSTVEKNRSNNMNHTANPVSPKPGQVQLTLALVASTFLGLAGWSIAALP